MGLPVERVWIDADPTVLDRPHHDYPAWDLPLPEGPPLYAVAAGTITTHNDPTCGLGVTLTQPDGHQWIYCHASEVAVFNNQPVAVGDHLARSGNTGNGTRAHLHLGYRDPNGVNQCPQPLLRATYSATIGTPRATSCVN